MGKFIVSLGIMLAFVAAWYLFPQAPAPPSPPSWAAAIERASSPPATNVPMLTREQLGNVTIKQMWTIRRKIALGDRLDSWPSQEVRAFVLLCLDHAHMDHCTTWRQ